jgi:hypothetical protein
MNSKDINRAVASFVLLATGGMASISLAQNVTGTWQGTLQAPQGPTSAIPAFLRLRHKIKIWLRRSKVCPRDRASA